MYKVVEPSFVFEETIVTLGLIFALIGTYFAAVAKGVAPGLGIDQDKATLLAFMTLTINAVLWFVLAMTITAH